MKVLAGKTAIITGSGRDTGIGKGIAMAFADAGCNVVISDIGVAKDHRFNESHIGTTDEMSTIVQEAKDKGVDAIAVACDVRSESEVENLISTTVEHFGAIDIMVNNAGIGYLMEPLVEFKEESWNAVLDVNLKGAFLCTKHSAKHMIDQGNGGRIINIASQAAKSGFPFAAAYTASKHGMIGLTRSNAVELGEHKITVNAVCPNHITTGLGQWQNEFFSEKMGMNYDVYIKGIRDKIPLGRVGLVDDIAKACIFLASDQSDYITGEALNVSGGEEMH
ncbi:MAG: SDR family oxidoreductase [Candidatus Marinimicrobia bacterium]|nr:SDR family oxidoreductase [Candidatus Neomarinimicrobiota bacterium]MBT5404708.1 SDR family oxidoreductase [Candidatus Neomarinimicrobiota bacterium]